MTVVLLSRVSSFEVVPVKVRPRSDSGKDALKQGTWRMDTFLYNQPPGPVSSAPDLEDRPLNLRNDAFQIGSEKASMLYHWDGHRFARYTTGD
jgi:hypothetical protein